MNVSETQARYAKILDEQDAAAQKGAGSTAERKAKEADAMAAQFKYLPKQSDNGSQWARRQHLARVLQEAERLRSKKAGMLGTAVRQARLDELEVEAEGLEILIANFDDLVS